MRAKQLALKFRMVVFIFFYLIGFTVAWDATGKTGTLWLAAGTAIARSGWIGLEYATVSVTILALGCLALGSSLRVWGRITFMYAKKNQAPLEGCAELRNPLYLGSWLIGLATAILMPAEGAAFFLVASSLFLLALRWACSDTQTVFQRVHNEASNPEVLRDPQGRLATVWLKSLTAEFFPISLTICFAIFAWSYNAHILVRCLLICFGLSLVFRAILGRPKA